MNKKTSEQDMNVLPGEGCRSWRPSRRGRRRAARGSGESTGRTCACAVSEDTQDLKSAPCLLEVVPLGVRVRVSLLEVVPEGVAEAQPGSARGVPAALISEEHAISEGRGSSEDSNNQKEKK